MTGEERKIYQQAITTWGYDAQEMMLLEEMAELQNALMKYHRNRDTADHIAEEIADVSIMLEQLKLMLDCEGLVESYIKHKRKRLAERLEAAT